MTEHECKFTQETEWSTIHTLWCQVGDDCSERNPRAESIDECGDGCCTVTVLDTDHSIHLSIY